MAIGHYGEYRGLHHAVMTKLSDGDARRVSEHMDWLRSTGRSRKTIEDRTRLLLRLDAWLAQRPEPRSLGTATANDIADWQVDICKKATETISTYVGHVIGYYQWCHEYRGAQDASRLLVRPRVPRRLPRPIDDESLQAALRLADGPVLISLLLMAFCGLRVGEVALVDRNDIRDHEVPPMIVVHGKGGKVRMVRMPNGLGPELRMAGIPHRGNIVLTPSGLPYSPGRLCQVVNAYLHDQGIPDTAHSLRHWYGTHTYRVTRDIRLVQEMLGHESINSTMGYTAFAPPHAEQLADELDVTMDAMLRPGVSHQRRLRIVPS
jgi:integrase